MPFNAVPLPSLPTIFFALSICSSTLAIAIANTDAPLVAATPTSSAPSQFITQYPVCGIFGFTEEPGDHDFASLGNETLTLEQCREACIGNGTCQAVSYAEVYGLCSFYSDPMECDKLIPDNTSYFGHWDNTCAFTRDDPVQASEASTQ